MCVGSVAEDEERLQSVSGGNDVRLVAASGGGDSVSESVGMWVIGDGDADRTLRMSLQEPAWRVVCFPLSIFRFINVVCVRLVLVRRKQTNCNA